MWAKAEFIAVMSSSTRADNSFMWLVARFAAVTVLCLAAGGCSSLSPRSSSASWVSALVPGESVLLDYESEGCFHSSHYELTFVPADGGLSVSGVDLSDYYDWTAKKIVHGARIPLSTIKLTHADAVRLDLLFEYYRAVKDGGCTTVDKGTITRKNGTVIKSAEHFLDASCGADESNDILTIYTLVTRMKPQKP